VQREPLVIQGHQEVMDLRGYKVLKETKVRLELQVHQHQDLQDLQDLKELKELKVLQDQQDQQDLQDHQTKDLRKILNQLQTHLKR